MDRDLHELFTTAVDFYSIHRSGVYRTRIWRATVSYRRPLSQNFNSYDCLCQQMERRREKNMAVIETLSTFKAKTSASFVRLSFLQNFNAK